MFTQIDESTENKCVHQSEVQQARSFHAVLFVALHIHVRFSCLLYIQTDNRMRDATL